MARRRCSTCSATLVYASGKAICIRPTCPGHQPDGTMTIDDFSRELLAPLEAREPAGARDLAGGSPRAHEFTT